MPSHMSRADRVKWKIKLTTSSKRRVSKRLIFEGDHLPLHIWYQNVHNFKAILEEHESPLRIPYLGRKMDSGPIFGVHVFGTNQKSSCEV